MQNENKNTWFYFYGGFMSDIEKVKYTKKVVLAGHSLTLSSDVSAEHLDEIVSYISEKIKVINSINKPVNSSLLGIILGIDICDEFFTYKRNNVSVDNELEKRHKAEIEKLKIKFLEDSKELKNTFDSQIEKVKESRSKESAKLIEENEKLKKELIKYKESNDSIVEVYKKQFNDELQDYKIVFEEETRDYIEQIEKLEKEKQQIEKELHKESFNKEQDILKIVEENSNLSEENLILRKRLEELMATIETEDIEGFFHEDENLFEIEDFDDMDLEVENMEEDIEVKAENENNNNTNTNENNFKHSKKKKKRRK